MLLSLQDIHEIAPCDFSKSLSIVVALVHSVAISLTIHRGHSGLFTRSPEKVLKGVRMASCPKGHQKSEQRREMDVPPWSLFSSKIAVHLAQVDRVLRCFDQS